MALIPPLHSYPIWKLWPGLDKASFTMHTCSAILDTKDQGPRAAGPGPAKVHTGRECHGGMTHPVVCEQGYDPNWIWRWTWIYALWDFMIYPIPSRGGCADHVGDQRLNLSIGRQAKDNKQYYEQCICICIYVYTHTLIAVTISYIYITYMYYNTYINVAMAIKLVHNHFTTPLFILH